MPRPTHTPLTTHGDGSEGALQGDAAYQVLRSRDARFDGRLFVGVTSTGIYCRPVCRVRQPRRENCRFFGQAALAEAAGFRPCLRCRPELAPGLSLTDSSDVLAAQAARLLAQAVHEGVDDALPAILPGVAARLGITDRHLRRIFQRAHGVTPMAWLTTQRLLLAKQLLTDTSLPVTQVALASGFASVRRFNAAFAQRYRLQPGALRKQSADGTAAAAAPRSAAHAGLARHAAHAAGDELRLAWRPPYDLAGVLSFLGARALPGIEQVDGLALRRTLALRHQGQVLAGWVQARFDADRHELRLALAPSLMPAVAAVRERARQALDLDADPARIDAQMAGLPGPARPGVRVPGGWCGFESAMRVILGQQVTVAAARTLTRRLVERFGTPLDTPFAGLDRLFPSAATLAAAAPEDIGTLGIVRQRVRALQALAQAVADGQLQLHRAAPLQPTLDALTALPGIGDWSAQLIAMRALAWPDAWPASDIGILNALGTRDVKAASAQAEAWRPWRAYAVMNLWLSLELSPPLRTDEAPAKRPGLPAGPCKHLETTP
ncbi:DNA-3-methyladenine glycosylase 2 family protein [Aquabacterium sp. OR-4]|uniref:DNA-3-methyladenine glycosylase 2 family protein n=1 Tax=Aquabacterium sp. OR-4 TaxID=2978127 RepID=UPI0021B17BB6|nr:AlkA N-terminal domain-containing protein [Aquabacterium sp. OR-4]MDT7834816.1 Ada metal-binding domain-containing protein [Aquabacterium sp. OR-4]